MILMLTIQYKHEIIRTAHGPPYPGSHILLYIVHETQIDAAYKQKKSTSKLLEEQASEWQQERDDFTHEIETLSAQLRDREKKCTAYGHVVKEVGYIYCYQVLNGQKSSLNCRPYHICMLHS